MAAIKMIDDKQSNDRKILLVSSSVPSRIEDKIVQNIYVQLRQNGFNIDKISISLLEFGQYIQYWKAVRSSRIVILHSSLLLSFVIAIFAKLNGKIIMALLWDAYPVIIDSKRYDNRLLRRFFDMIENWVLKNTHYKIVPSDDFLAHKPFRNAKSMPIWSNNFAPLAQIKTNNSKESLDDEYVRILFAGQVNITRGLVQAISKLRQLFGSNFTLIIASPSAIPTDISNMANIEETGFLAHEALAKIAARCDCGLVSIHPDFETPAFPSKSFDYLAWNLPILYFGKALPHYGAILENSGAGLDINHVEKLNKQNIKSLAVNFKSKRDKFHQKTMLDSYRLIDHIQTILQRL